MRDIIYPDNHKEIELEEGMLKDPTHEDAHLHPVNFRVNKDGVEQGIEVDFYSEHSADELKTMRIQFHKGNTYFMWMTDEKGTVLTSVNDKQKEESAV